MISYKCKCGTTNPADFYQSITRECKACRLAAEKRYRETVPVDIRRARRADMHSSVSGLRAAARDAIAAKLGFFPRGCDIYDGNGEMSGHCPLYAECVRAIAEWRDVACCLSSDEVDALTAGAQGVAA